MDNYANQLSTHEIRPKDLGQIINRDLKVNYSIILGVGVIFLISAKMLSIIAYIGNYKIITWLISDTIKRVMTRFAGWLNLSNTPSVGVAHIMIKI